MGSYISVCKYIICVFTLMLHCNVNATNGINLIGFGGESIGMAGADIAVARDTTALNTNPAGLYQIDNKRLDIYNAINYAIDLNHSDMFGNQDEKIENEFIFIGNVGYAKKLQNIPVTLGIGVFAQGGFGVDFSRLNNQFGTRDDLSSQFRVLRITPGFSWKINEKLALGASAVITYSDLEQEIFPNTSVLNPMNPNQSFFGLDIKDTYTIEPGFKFGLMYELSGKTKIGMSYTSKVELDLEDGEADVNLTALGLGVVEYDEVKASGVDQPQEFGIGMSHQFNEKFLLALELNWLNWKNAVRRSKLEISDPDNPAAPAILTQELDLDWRDQYVMSVGMEYKMNDKMTFRGGYNYARNPIPDRSISPLLSPITEHHITAGLEYKINDRWAATTTLEYDVNASATYSNPQLPFGENAKIEGEFVSIHSLLSRRW